MCGFGKSILPNGLNKNAVANRDAKAMGAYVDNGYKVITVWGHELNDKKALVAKLRNFTR